MEKGGKGDGEKGADGKRKVGIGKGGNTLWICPCPGKFPSYATGQTPAAYRAISPSAAGE